jgi:hypothetical protein
MTQTGITKQGKFSTTKLVSLLSGSKEITELRVGDVEWPKDGKSIIVEVKKNTPNQTRPMLYNVLVVHEIRNGKNNFYVVPPDDVLKICTAYRGQHTPIAAACFNFPMNKTNKKKYLVPTGEAGVADAISAAYVQGEKSAHKKIALQVVEDMEKLNETFKNMILNA